MQNNDRPTYEQLKEAISKLPKFQREEMEYVCKCHDWTFEEFAKEGARRSAQEFEEAMRNVEKGGQCGSKKS